MCSVEEFNAKVLIKFLSFYPAAIWVGEEVRFSVGNSFVLIITEFCITMEDVIWNVYL